MKNHHIIPGYSIYEYKLVLNPHEELRNKIINLKKEFSENHHPANIQNSIPQVVLVTFKQYSMIEERLITRLQNIAMGFHKIKLELKDFGSFPSHTIYINITSKVPIQNLVKMIRAQSQRLMKLNDEYKPYFIMEPYVTIARKLSSACFDKAWLEYRSRHFSARFIAEDMLLFKRAQGELNYNVVRSFQFQNLPVGISQGDLFT